MMSGHSNPHHDLTKGEAPTLSPLFRLETLKSRQLFKEAAGGPRFSTPAFTMVRHPGQSADEGIASPQVQGLRFGFTVTKKIGNAVERNRIRRRLKAAVCSASVEFPVMTMDLVILARKEAMTLGFQQLVQDVVRAVGALARRPGDQKKAAGKPHSSRQTGKTVPAKLGKPSGPD